uniref:Uncharacterized protein n=1 Tax=Anguilla anguilla TaxID=7936 RepID=A0A0E9R7Q0_ANGAN
MQINSITKDAHCRTCFFPPLNGLIDNFTTIMSLLKGCTVYDTEA